MTNIDRSIQSSGYPSLVLRRSIQSIALRASRILAWLRECEATIRHSEHTKIRTGFLSWGLVHRTFGPIYAYSHEQNEN